MALETSYGPDQRAFADAIAAFARDHRKAWQPDPVTGFAPPAFPTEVWRGLADLGVLGLGRPDSGAAPADVAAAAEALGREGVPGPLWHTMLAGALLDTEAVATGAVVVSAGVPALMPWATDAGVFLDLTGLREGEIWHCTATSVGEPVAMLGHESWAPATLHRERSLAVPASAVLLADLAHAGYLVGAADRILADAAAYVASRQQFGRALGDFQGVALPLAACAARLSAAGALVRRAAATGDPVTGQLALASSARAARETLYQCHQGYGAIGFTEEGPLAWLGPRIGLLAAEAESPWRRPTDTALLGAPTDDLAPARRVR